MPSDPQRPTSWWDTLPGIITAVAALITAIGGLIAILLKNPAAPPSPSPAPATVAAVGASPAADKPPAPATAGPVTLASAAPSPAVDHRREAELLGVQYATAMLKRDLPTLVERASMPFYMDNRVLLSPDDVRRGYESLLKQPEKDEDIAISSVETRTIGEWKARGLDPTHDRLLKSITLSDDDFLVAVVVPHNALGIYMRRAGGTLSVAGWWN